jgi:hypothetical protein
MMRLLRSSVVFAACAVMIVSACGTTTVLTTTTVAPPTSVDATTTLPAGTLEELLPRVRDIAFSLSTAIIDGNGSERFDEIDTLWRAAAAQLERTTFRESTQYQIDLMRTAVERKRPADADKASLQVKALIENFLASDS